MIPLTVEVRLLAYTWRVEWMLQVVDEIDDAVAVIRHRWLGFDAHIGVLAAGIAAFAAAAAGVMLKTSLVILRALP